MVASSYIELTRKDDNDDDEEVDQIIMDMSTEGGRDDEENNDSPSSPAPNTYHPRRGVFAIGCACFVAGFLLGVMFLGGYRSFFAVGGGSSQSLHGGSSSSIGISNELAEDEIVVDDFKSSSSSATVSTQTFAMESSLGSEEETNQNVAITNNFMVLKQVNHDRTSFT
jgi:hypothetical protein